MRLLDVYPAPQYSGSAEVVPEGKKTYYIREEHMEHSILVAVVISL